MAVAQMQQLPALPLGILSHQNAAPTSRGHWPGESFLTELIRTIETPAQFLSVPPFFLQPIWLLLIIIRSHHSMRNFIPKTASTPPTN